MKSDLAWVGFLWIGAVVVAATLCFGYITHQVFNTDATVLPWLLLPAAGVIALGAFVAAIPGAVILAYRGIKARRVKAQEVAQSILSELTAAPDASRRMRGQPR